MLKLAIEFNIINRLAKVPQQLLSDKVSFWHQVMSDQGT